MSCWLSAYSYLIIKIRCNVDSLYISLCSFTSSHIYVKEDHLDVSIHPQGLNLWLILTFGEILNLHIVLCKASTISMRWNALLIISILFSLNFDIIEMRLYLVICMLFFVKFDKWGGGMGLDERMIVYIFSAV